jgi:hypothetical protein
MNLFLPVETEDKWHPNFHAIMKSRNGYNCDVLNDWAKGFIDRDGKFVKEFQTTFNSCFWELYLNAVFNFYKFKIDWTYSSPDFCIKEPIEMVVEATIASNEKDGDPEYLTFQTPIPQNLNEFNRKTIIRLSNSINSKVQKYREKYSEQPNVIGKPFIIAVSAFNQPYFSMACQRSIEALLFKYYVDEEEYLKKNDKSKPLVGKQLDRVFKDNGSAVELGLFSEPIIPEVSAIIFSSAVTWSKVTALSNDPNPNIFFKVIRYNPNSVYSDKLKIMKFNYNESLLDGLRIYYNPCAHIPIDPKYFRNKDVYQSYFNFGTNEWEYEIREGLLNFRQASE